MATTNLMTEITKRYSKMTKAEKKVADYVLSSPQQALASTISDLAKLCGIGETSVFRFCRTLSLNGYQDFKLSLALSTANTPSFPKDEIDILDSDDCKGIAESVLRTYTAALDHAFLAFNFKAISKAAGLILSSKSVNLFGFGGSGTSANEAKNKFLKILPNIIYNSDSHIQLTQAALLGEGDLAIIFCNSGITKDCIEIARICHTGKASVVFVTMFLKTPAAQYCDIILPCGANEGPMEGGSIAAKTSQLFLIDILYAEVFKRLGADALHRKKITSQVITEKMM
ncbi:MurR/RpiR family transcriptional regulator [Hespellia stercorisuis]|uniref:Transcriptional regulator, RpiR family n=1 Tax=Hespellia stercorisuis DSM 15480 TaxID=1121950 RepID=A0A1M6K968_9FIRM|nr:MurR/RpiR family transcriptional regulator [Hespellia stercorisuis]SHJ55453.1 transcriptional regulator, RpiR family [Hespellia stercorisuis DSM 15480]